LIALMLNLAVALALAAATPDTVPAPPAPAVAEPAVVVLRQPALPIVALRLSLLADDPPGYAGAGHLMQHLHLDRLEERVRRVGGRVQAVRTSDAVVYTVVGPAAELGYLAETLSAVLRAPNPGTAEVLAAMATLGQERGAEREIASQYVRAALRARLFPEDLPAAGTEASLSRLNTARLNDVWAAMYRPDHVSIVAVGDVEIEGVRRVFRDVPAAAGGGVAPLADTVRAFAADTPQATRGWFGRAWKGSQADPAALTVTSRLLRNHLRRRMTRSAVDVEHWWTHHGQGLALVVATADSLVPVARRTVDGSLTALRDNLDETLVRDAAASVRREMLFFARTPERMADVLGAFADRGEEAGAAQRFYAAVAEVTEADVRAVLDLLLEEEPAVVEVPPQRLPRS
jgi:predicted Zn-dependent peptidase